MKPPDEHGPDNSMNYPELDDLVSPHVIKAIEIYDTPAEIPVEFNAMGSVCGVLVIWTHGAG